MGVWGFGRGGNSTHARALTRVKSVPKSVVLLVVSYAVSSLEAAGLRRVEVVAEVAETPLVQLLVACACQQHVEDLGTEKR